VSIVSIDLAYRDYRDFGAAVLEPTPSGQALVSGLAGLGVVAGTPNSYDVIGSSPFVLEGAWREGFIINPKRPQHRRRVS
jgi:hypothetical protein